MSQENVDIFRASTAVFNRQGLEVWVKALDPYVVIRPDARWPGRPTIGRDAPMGSLRISLRRLGGGEVLIEDLIDAGDSVVARLRINVHGQESDIEQEGDLSTIHTFRRGKVIMIEYFLDHGAALQAAGLGE